MKNYSKGALQSANKKLVVIVAISLVLILGASVVLSVGFGKYGTDTSKWFKSPSANQQDPQIVVTPDPETSSLMTLSLGAVTVAEDGTKTQSVTASMASNVAPKNKAVTWTLSFANPSSAWAKGKTVTNYVTVTPTAEGALTATLTFKQAFGEQILLTCQSVVKPEVKKVAYVDCVKHIESYSLNINGADAVTSPFTLYLSADDVTNQNTIEFSNIVWSVGTVTPDINMNSVEIPFAFDSGSLDGFFYDACEKGYVPEETYEIFYNNVPVNFAISYATGSYTFKINIRDFINKEYPFQDSSVQDILYQMFYDYYGNTEIPLIDCNSPIEGKNRGYIKVNYELEVNENVYYDSETVYAQGSIYNGGSLLNFNVMPSKLGLDSTSIYFY